ncbi:MAG: peptidoglycan DD-metalloendopeptidase family protein [Actinobacteria bacterium]|nr:peptidoglycan DD-metalloendopeptidase family protein [Actinomycetota bacterium]
MMGRRAGTAVAALVLSISFLLAGTAAGDPGADKYRVDSELERLRSQAVDTDRRAGVLTEELSAVAGRVRELQSGVDAQHARLDVLEGTLARAQARLGALDRTIAAQTARYARLRGEYVVALDRLELRVRELYMTDELDALSLVLGTTSFTDIIDNLELLGRIGEQDERIAARVKGSRDDVREARRRTRLAREEAARVEEAVASATSEQRSVVTRLVASRDALVAARRTKSVTLASIEGDRETVLEEIDALEAQSAELAAQIRLSQQESPVTPVVQPSGSGILGWPVSGPVTSGFGMRWGRMHEGIDIAVGSGTSVRASAAGSVIYAGWLGGYGNLVVVDHGGGLSTAYAHNSSFASSVGQTVVAGEVVAYSGNTGNSSGPHVHFEVRVNGSAVDPLGYL